MFAKQLVFGIRELESAVCLTESMWVIYLLRFYPVPAWRLFLPELMQGETGTKIVRQQLLMHIISIINLRAFFHWHGRGLLIRSVRSLWGLQYCLLVLFLITDENLQQWFSLFFFFFNTKYHAVSFPCFLVQVLQNNFLPFLFLITTPPAPPPHPPTSRQITLTFFSLS